MECMNQDGQSKYSFESYEKKTNEAALESHYTKN